MASWGSFRRSLATCAVVMTLPVHPQVHQRASEQEKERKIPDDVRAVAGEDEQSCRSTNKHPEGHVAPGHRGELRSKQIELCMTKTSGSTMNLGSRTGLLCDDHQPLCQSRNSPMDMRPSLGFLSWAMKPRSSSLMNSAPVITPSLSSSIALNRSALCI